MGAPLIRLIVGLGNPTSSYERTRHNVGRRFIDFLAAESKQKISKIRHVEGFRVSDFFGIKLPSYMNQSGPVLKNFLTAEEIKPQETLVVFDDFMIPLGSLRLRSKGSSGGHNGLQSIIEALGTEEVGRLRVGIGPVPEKEDPADFVLEKFTASDEKALPHVLASARNGVKLLLAEGYQKAMNSVNKIN